MLGARLALAIASFLLLLLSAQWLGAEGRGYISLFVLGVSFSAIVSEVIAGPVLVYMVPRYHLKRLQQIAYAWSLMGSVFVFPVLWLSNTLVEGYEWLLFLACVLQAINAANHHLLLGLQKYVNYQTVILIAPLLLLSGVIIGKTLNVLSIEFYFLTYTLSHLVAFLFGSLSVMKTNSSIDSKVGIRSLFMEALKLGGYIQLANLSLLLINRLAFYILNHHSGVEHVGVYSTSLTLTESVLMIASSIAIVLYSKLANRKQGEKLGEAIIQIAWFSFLISCLPVIILLLLPQKVYVLLLGDDFVLVKDILFLLAPAVLFNAFYSIIGHYFSSSAKYRINAIIGLIGTLVAVPLAWLLIETFDIKGAAIMQSLVALIMLVLYLRKLQSMETLKLAMFKPSLTKILKAIKTID
jgi:O-antigen/teichoic acid export membrane protein